MCVCCVCVCVCVFVCVCTQACISTPVAQLAKITVWRSPQDFRSEERRVGHSCALRICACVVCVCVCVCLCVCVPRPVYLLQSHNWLKLLSGNLHKIFTIAPLVSFDHMIVCVCVRVCVCESVQNCVCVS